MTVRTRLEEVDRQLSEQRAQADAFATRSGLMIAATALLTGFLSRSVPTVNAGLSPVIWVVAGAAAIGILVLCSSRLIMGPTPSQIGRWADKIVEENLLDAKLLAVEVNSRVLLRSEVIFVIQALTTVIGIGLLVFSLLN